MLGSMNISPSFPISQFRFTAGYLVTSFSKNSKEGMAFPALYLQMDMSLEPISRASR
jgi:hypothetical protein